MLLTVTDRLKSAHQSEQPLQAAGNQNVITGRVITGR